MKKILATLLAFGMSFSGTTWAANLLELRDGSNVIQMNITDAATPVIEQADLAGNADTATALAANGSNCSAGSAPLGVDDAGAVEGCFDVETDAEATSHEGDSSAHHTATVNTDAESKCSGTDNYLDGEGNCDVLVTDTGAPHGNGANCSAGSAPLGMDAAGAAEGCFDVETDTEATAHEGNSSAHHAATVDTNAGTICSGTGNYLDGEGNCDALTTAITEYEGRETTAAICSSTPAQPGNFKTSLDDFDLYTATGSAIGQWRNSRTGVGPC